MLKHPVAIDIERQEAGTAIPDLSSPPLKNTVGRTGPDNLRLLPNGDQGLPERCFVLDEHRICGLFKGYFNNKMTLLIFMIQSARFGSDPKLAQPACGFLNDLYHHMLEPGLQKKYHLVFLWLKKFILKLPHVTRGQQNKALGFIHTLYDIFGIPLKSNIERGAV